MNILLDMDGVLADFAKEAINVLNQKYDKQYTIESYARDFGKFGMNEYYGISIDDFWESLEYPPRKDGYSFWDSIEPFPWAKDLYSWLSEIGDVTIVTAPSEHIFCIPAKKSWLQRHLGVKARDVIFAHKKYLFAGNGLLIDDYKKNVIDFMNAGGDAILIPSTWNTVNLTYEDVKQTILSNL